MHSSYNPQTKQPKKPSCEFQLTAAQRNKAVSNNKLSSLPSARTLDMAMSMSPTIPRSICAALANSGRFSSPEVVMQILLPCRQSFCACSNFVASLNDQETA